MEYLLGLFAVAALIVYLLTNNDKKRKELWSIYQAAIKSGDRQQALRAGRAYYAERRRGAPTHQDEQALANDLSVM